MQVHLCSQEMAPGGPMSVSGRTVSFAKLIILSLLAVSCPELQAQDGDPRYLTWTNRPVVCNFPLADLPFNGRDRAFPSMQQSLGLTACIYELGHRTILRLFGPPETWWEGFWRRMTVVGYDLFLMQMPLGESWLHEEWHRAVMSVHGISSYNEVYDLELGASVIQVSGVHDDELAKLKAESNPDLVRLAAAGVESSLALVHRLERHQFFDDARLFNLPLYIMSISGVISYIDSADTARPGEVKGERTDQKTETERDFVGHDFTS
jgi:hypothetical protein